MADIFEVTKNTGNFTMTEYAEGLFYQQDLRTLPNIRIQAPSIAMVFTDGAIDLGADLDGFLFYRDIKDFDMATGSIDYRVSEVIDPTDFKYYAQVDFFKGLSPQPCAVFLASDPDKIVNQLTMDNQAGSGQWAKLDIGYSTAVMEKNRSSTAVTITARSIRMKATFLGTHFKAPEFTIKGNLAYGAVSQIFGGTTAGSCLDDRIFFCPPGTHSNFKAFFMPFTDAGRIGLDRSTDLGNVAWSKF
ncbi:hypothetical protein EV702DRAFT_1072736 [Suillus placidus]|uniref:Uncharacterized protein n=1 Tax=Suillus placidus TaxID=48579 RepID=A0A9P7A409_9AGAM|nr:hypothetical protein EV702DRAFT_1072736 [Suillus placidus]